MTVRLRPELGRLAAYRPGRSARDLGLASVVKLASNESAFGPLPGAAAAIASAATQANRYPDNGSAELTAALADRCGVGPEQVAVGCGSVGLYQQLVASFAGPGDEVVYAWRSFEVYPAFLTIAGATGVPLPLVDHTHDLAAMAAAVTDHTRMIFICNPNNPTATAVASSAIHALLDAVPDDVLIVIDEAYHEFVTDPDVPDALTLLAQHENVAVLRTMSKAYGLAGLRVGYCVAAPAIIEALRRVQLPFTVSSVAQAAALASLAAAAELTERVDATLTERDRVVATLGDLGVQVPPSQANFYWLPLRAQAAPFASACERAGVVVRAFAGDGVRVTVGTPADNDCFLEVARPLLR